MKKLALAIILLTGIFGCATTPTPTEGFRPVAPNRTFLITNLPGEGGAKAVFVFDSRFSSSQVEQHLFIDGRRAALLYSGEKVEFTLPPGEHVFGLKPQDIWGLASLENVTKDLKSGRRYFFRIKGDEKNLMLYVLQEFVPFSN